MQCRQSQFQPVQQQTPLSNEHFAPYNTLTRQCSPRPQNYDIMWRTEYQFGTSLCDRPVSGQYYEAVSCRYDDSWHNGYVSQYIVDRGRPQCDNYSDEQWHGTSGGLQCSRVRVSKRSRSLSRRPRHDNVSRCRWRHEYSRSSRRRSDMSRSAAVTDSVSGRRQFGHSESDYSAVTSQRRSRHRRHHRRRRYSSSTSSSPSSTSSTVSQSPLIHIDTDNFFLCHCQVICCFLC